jgi:hypothetical protein
MNRAMGFGIATSAMMGSALVTPSPASAHATSITGPFGAVSVGSSHTIMVVQDYSCSDNQEIYARFKTTTLDIIFVAGPLNCGQVTIHSRDYVGTTGGTFAWYQKCNRGLGGAADGCSEAKAV